MEVSTWKDSLTSKKQTTIALRDSKRVIVLSGRKARMARKALTPLVDDPPTGSMEVYPKSTIVKSNTFQAPFRYRMKPPAATTRTTTSAVKSTLNTSSAWATAAELCNCVPCTVLSRLQKCHNLPPRLIQLTSVYTASFWFGLMLSSV